MASADSSKPRKPAPASSHVATVARLYRGESTLACADAHLLERFLRSRDQSAFEALVLRHGPMVLATCKRILADPHAAEDAFQSTFLTLAIRAHSIRHVPSLGPWLHRVASRIALRARKQAALLKLREQPLQPDTDLTIPVPRPPDHPHLLDLDAELDRLPPNHRAPVILCYLEGHTHEEAARALHWPIGSVKGRLARARATLQKRLESRTTHNASCPLPLAAALDACSRAARAPLPSSTLTQTVQIALATPTKLNPLVPLSPLIPGALHPMFWNKGLALAAACGLCLLAAGLLTAALQRPDPNAAQTLAALSPLAALDPQRDDSTTPKSDATLDGSYTLTELDAGPDAPAQRLMHMMLTPKSAFRSIVIRDGIITLYVSNDEHPHEKPHGLLTFSFSKLQDQPDYIDITPDFGFTRVKLPGILRRDPDRLVIILDATGESRPPGVGIKITGALVRWTLVPQQTAAGPKPDPPRPVPVPAAQPADTDPFNPSDKVEAAQTSGVPMPSSPRQADRLKPGDIHIKAGDIRINPSGMIEARGDVQIAYPDRTLRAERVLIDRHGNTRVLGGEQSFKNANPQTTVTLPATPPTPPALAPIRLEDLAALNAQISERQSTLELTLLALEQEKRLIASRSARIEQLEDAIETQSRNSEDQTRADARSIAILRDKLAKSRDVVPVLTAQVHNIREELAIKQAELAEKSRLTNLGQPRKILPGDILLIEVLEALPGRPITGERTVKPDGTISLGFYGEIPVAGLTRHEIKLKVIEQLRKFLNDEVLGLVDTDPASGKSVPIPTADSNRVFVDEVAPAASTPSDRIQRLETEIERLRVLLNFKQSMIPSTDTNRPDPPDR